MWYTQVPQLSEYFKVITFDNRDTGNSDRVAVPYTIADMAGDLIALIEHLGLGPVHLLGISMGGMIAQQTVLSRPDLVKTLILGCTTCNAATGDDYRSPRSWSCLPPCRNSRMKKMCVVPCRFSFLRRP